MAEFVAGTLVKITMAFVNEITGLPEDPSAATLAIQIGVLTPTSVTLSDFVPISTGLWYYLLDTTSAPGEYVAQVQSTGSLAAISFPSVFTVLPPSISLLT
jgi:hypothetical protein